MIHTLLYAKKLIAIGMPREQAEAQVEIMAELVEDQLVTKQDFKDLDTRVDVRFKEIQTSIDVRFKEMQTSIDARFKEMQISIDMRFKEMKTYVDTRFNDLENRLTIKLGLMMAASIGIVATIISLNK